MLHTLGEPDNREYNTYAYGGPWEELHYYWGPPGGLICKVGFRCVPANTMWSIWYPSID